MHRREVPGGYLAQRQLSLAQTFLFRSDLFLRGFEIYGIELGPSHSRSSGLDLLANRLDLGQFPSVLHSFSGLGLEQRAKIDVFWG
jgi:hypothetical protein